MVGMVPAGNVLPIPLHTSRVMIPNNNSNRFAENEPQQSLFQNSHPGIIPCLNQLIALVHFGYQPQSRTQNSWQVPGQLPSFSQIHLPHLAGQQQSASWEPVQESQAVSRPERRNGMEWRGRTFFPPPRYQQGSQGGGRC